MLFWALELAGVSTSAQKDSSGVSVSVAVRSASSPACTVARLFTQKPAQHWCTPCGHRSLVQESQNVSGFPPLATPLGPHQGSVS